MVPRTGEALLEAQEFFPKASQEAGIQLLAGAAPVPTTYYKRAFLFIFGILVSTDPAVNKKNREGFRKLIKLCAERGYV